MRAFALTLAAFAAMISLPATAQDFPELSGRVVDEANIIPDEVEQQLTQQLEALEQQSQRQLVVATVPDLQGYDISDYGYQLGRYWGIGDAERNDGALLIVAPNERKVRIEIGYGLEGIMTDALSSLIIQNQIVPRFRDGDMPGGIVAGTNALVQQLALPEDQARLVAQEAGQQRERDSGGDGVGFLIWFAFIFFFFILPMLRGRGRRRRYGVGDTVSDIILWEVGKGIARGISNGGGSSWGGGGGFGGGGFSGGGGSFGGGGASGGW